MEQRVFFFLIIYKTTPLIRRVAVPRPAKEWVQTVTSQFLDLNEPITLSFNRLTAGMAVMQRIKKQADQPT